MWLWPSLDAVLLSGAAEEAGLCWADVVEEDLFLLRGLAAVEVVAFDEAKEEAEG